MQLQGVFTAIVTPFNQGSVDFKKLEELIEFQIKNGVDGIVPVGTTGESPTLSVGEHIKVIETTVRASAGRCLVIAGSGANSTSEAVELTLQAKKVGADATLQVTPYYNKPTQEGLYRHFSAVADKAGLPVVLYNIPGRSGVPIDVQTIARLRKNPAMIAVKEAGGSVERVSAILDACDITVLSGDDGLTLPMMSVGAKGVISVASNIIPADMKRLVSSFLEGRPFEAEKIHRKYYGLIKNLFIETNPIPVKTAMAMMGMIHEEFRLPICEMAAKNKDVLRDTLKSCGLI